MAKKRKATPKRRPSRRRKMSGTGGDGLALFGLIILGAVGSKFISRFVGAKLDPKLLNGLMGGAGILGALNKIPGGVIVKGLTIGIGVGGTMSLLADIGVLKGIGAVGEDYEMEFISGMGARRDLLQAIAGDDDDDDQEQGFAIAGQGNDNLSVLAGVFENDDMEEGYGADDWNPAVRGMKG